MTARKATTYLILEAKRQWGSSGSDGLARINEVRVVGQRANRPTKLARDQIAVRISVEVDDAVFSPVTADLALSIDPANLIRPVVIDLPPEEPATDE